MATNDDVSLPGLDSLDEEHYNQWLATVRENPQTIELEIAGIWTRLKDREKAEALSEAYRDPTSWPAQAAQFEAQKS